MKRVTKQHLMDQCHGYGLPSNGTMAELQMRLDAYEAALDWAANPPAPVAEPLAERLRDKPTFPFLVAAVAAIAVGRAVGLTK